MTKAQLQKIMKRNKILFFEVEDTIDFIRDLLSFQARELEEMEPYATSTIQRLNEATCEVDKLHDYIECAMNNEKKMEV